MKVSLFFMFLTTLTVSANVDLMSQQVNLNFKDATLREVLSSLKEQSGHMIIYSNDELSQEKGRITVNMENVALSAALDVVLKGLPYQYTIVDQMVMIIPVRETTQQAPAQSTITGKVIDSDGKPLAGVTVLIIGTTSGATTDTNGQFTLRTSRHEDVVLRFSYIGKKDVTVTYTGQANIAVKMEDSASEIGQVVVSTGYSTIPLDRQTGSFGYLPDTLIRKLNSPNLLNRIEGLVPGIYVDIKNSDHSFLYGQNKYSGGLSQNEQSINVGMTIRGISTGTNAVGTKPLVVLDGFATELELKNLNPSDVESITFLKDAAAASIWGARAANGVMVITTKKGKQGSAPAISFRTRVSFSDKPRFNTLPFMNASQMINYEKDMMKGGFITAPSTSSYSASAGYSQAAELMFSGMSQTALDAALNELAARESYRDLKKYLIQSSLNQTYDLSVMGGGEQSSYFVSAAYAKERSTNVGHDGRRLNITSNLSFKLFNWATLSTNMRGTFFKLNKNSIGLTPLNKGSNAPPLMPYDYFIDDNGKEIGYYRSYYREFSEKKEELGYRDWKYYYISDLNNLDKVRKENHLGMDVGLDVPIPKVRGLSVRGSFAMETSFVKEREYYNEDTFYIRDRYNYGTYYDGSNLIREYPRGGYLNLMYSDMFNWSARGQINYNNVIADDHNVSFLAGIELRETRDWFSSSPYYGYDAETLVGSMQLPGTYKTVFGSNGYFSTGTPETDYQRRYLSYYSNFSYTFRGKYVWTGSVRYDDYNNFGLDRKYRATPMWSTGLSWHIKRERFMENVNWLNNLTVRATYGYNGNINPDVYPFTNVSLSSSTDVYTDYPTSSINFAANPSIRWEKVGVLNLGLNFSLLNNRLSGSFDIYRKYARDLFAKYKINPTFGANASSLYELTRNAAKIDGKGFDLGLTGIPVQTRDFRWTAGLNISKTKEKVVSSPIEMSASFYGSPSSVSMLEGYPVSSTWVYRWAGLDENGDSQIYDKDGKILKYTDAVTNDDLKYIGRTSPECFGGFHNTFSYKGVELFVMISYKFGYVFRRPTVGNFPINNTRYENHMDMDLRWREKGDEASTDVPRLNTPKSSVSRYTLSDLHYHKGDHIRLKEISLSYNLTPFLKNISVFKGARIGFSINNVGLLWKKNKVDIDPDFIQNSTSFIMKPSPSYSFSFDLNF